VGTINGVFYSLVNGFDLAQYGLTMAFSDPAQFALPAWISCGAVFLSATSFSWYTWRMRGHLWHIKDFFRKHG